VKVGQEDEKTTAKIDKQFPGFKVLNSLFFYKLEDKRLKVKYTGKRRQRPVEGDLFFAGRNLQPQETIYDEPFDLDYKMGSHFAKCLVATSCQFTGTLFDIGTFSFVPKGNPYDLFITTLSGPKWRAVKDWWESPRKHNSVLDFIGEAQAPETYVRGEVREFIPERYKNYYDHSYVNTTVTPAGFAKTIFKLEGTRKADGKVHRNWNLSPAVIMECYLYFLKDLDFSRAHLPVDLSKSVCQYDFYRHGAALGFDAYRVKYSGSKGNNTHMTFQQIKYFMNRVFVHGDRVQDIAPCPAYTMSMKAEVRGPDVPVDKVRVLMTNEMFTDFLKDCVMRPAYNFLKKHPGYMAGVNFRDNFIPKMMKKLRHPYSRIWYPNHVVWEMLKSYITLDIGGQDGGYTNEEKHLLLKTIMMFFEISDDWDVKIREVFAYVLANSDINFVQLYGGMFFANTGNLSTGDKFTALINFLMARFSWVLSIQHTAKKKFIEVLRWIESMNFGDDQVSVLPTTLAKKLFGENLDKFCSEILEALGVNYKPDESFLLHPIEGHQDRFFTKVEDDLISSRGINFLKRHIVKLDKDLNIAHPDAKYPDFYCFGLWRSSNDFVARIGLDPLRWNNSNRPWVKWFRKAFGLIVDAGCNRTVHNMIKTAVLELKDRYPEQWEQAWSGLQDDVYFDEFREKLGDLDGNLMRDIFDHPDSFKTVVGLFMPTAKGLFDLRRGDINTPTSWFFIN
jgi:hypothetical protein